VLRRTPLAPLCAALLLGACDSGADPVAPDPPPALALVADPSLEVRVLLAPDGKMDNARSLPIPPAGAPLMLPAGTRTSDALVAFAPGRPPRVRHGLPRTERRDTLRLDFAPPVRVPLTLWIIRGPFATVAGEMRRQVEAARATWGDAGIDLSDVRLVDVTEDPRATLLRGPAAACGLERRSLGFDEGRTNVYVAGPVLRGGVAFGGYSCGADHVDLSATALGLGTLLAHELGHSFGLEHDAAENVMNPAAVHGGLTTGQVFHAHASRLSSIPTRYAGPAALLPPRDCARPGECLPPDFDPPR